MRRRTTLVVVAAVVVLALVGAAVAAGLGALDRGEDTSSSPETVVTPQPVTPEPGASDAPDPALAPFYSQRLDWQQCPDDDDAWCSRLEVPVDYADPTGQTIGLSLLKVPATKKRTGSLVVNPGGPGAPGTSYAASARSVFRDPVTDHYDVVGFDPRGTGGSDPVDCLTDEELTAFLATDPSPDTPEEVQALVSGQEQLFAGCVRRSDALVGHVTTVEAARDMDVLRAALGDTQLDYFGASYGTKLGATYASLFPQQVGRMVLDGALDPSLSSRELTLDQARGFETALRAYVADCVEGGDCPLGDSVEEGLASISDLLDQIDATPLPTSDGRELGIGNAFYGLVTPLYNRDYWYILTRALSTAQDGDGSVLQLLADAYASRQGGEYTDNSLEAFYAINCLDDPYSIGPDQVPAQLPEFEKASPTLGPVFAWSLVGCRGVRERASVEAPRIRAAGAAPIVVVGTTRDPATPYAEAVALARQLESGVLVSRDGDGHTGYNAGNECVDDAVESYLLEGTVPEDGLSC